MKWKPLVGLAQHCQLQFPGQEVTMISRRDRKKTLVALAIWVGGSQAHAARLR
jgi:hypothetical protein